MPTITPFERLFGTAGPLGLTWVKNANLLFSLAAPHHLAVSTGLLKASQVRLTYGHWRIKTLCKTNPTLQYSKAAAADLPLYLGDKMDALNPSALVSTGSCLATLRKAPVGFILLVVQSIQAIPTTLPPPPVIMIVIALSLATLDTLEDDEEPGIFLANIWDPKVMAIFGKDFNPEDPHCPLLAASKGFS
jgi:hypothetical protein